MKKTKLVLAICSILFLNNFIQSKLFAQQNTCLPNPAYYLSSNVNTNPNDIVMEGNCEGMEDSGTGDEYKGSERIMAKYNNYIVNFASKNNISIYPNPANDKINVIFTTDNSQQEYMIKLFDYLGKEILTQKSSNATTLNISNLSNGLYFVSVSNGVELFRKSITIIH